jgi:RNA polymerase sigma-70 factor, ECF subfamily
MAETADDDELVARVLEGDHEAFGVLVGRHERYVRKVAIKLLGAGADAVDDATQDTFARAYTSLAGYAARGLFRAWLARIAASRCYELRRRRRRFAALALDLLPPPPDPAPGPDDLAVAREVGAALAAALAALPSDQRDAVLLCDRDGLKYREAGEALGVAQQTIATRVFRGRRKLRGLLGAL